MEIDLTRTEFETIYDALSKGRLVSGRIPSKDAAEATIKGYLIKTKLQNGIIFFEISGKGCELLKSVNIHAIQVNVPNQPPLFLRNHRELIRTIDGGCLSDTFVCLQDGEYESGDLLFSLSVKEMSLYDLATLPEWEPT